MLCTYEYRNWNRFDLVGARAGLTPSGAWSRFEAMIDQNHFLDTTWWESKKLIFEN